MTVDMIERAVTFECAGERLVGIVSDPGGRCALGVVVVVGGPQYRIGSHRQFLLLARRLAQAGIPVLRFDYRGMGDSSGPLQDFEHIEPDIAAAIGALAAACPAVKSVVLWGLCDAASANLLYWQATADPRIAGIALLNPWVMSEATYAQSKIRDYYLQRLMTRAFWAKLARGGVDIGGAVRSIAEFLKRARGGRDGSAAPAEIDYRERMRLALSQFPGPILVVLSGMDLTAKAFREQARSAPDWHGVLERANVEQRELPAADHTFSTAAWREEVEALTLDWLRRLIPTARIAQTENFSKDS